MQADRSASIGHSSISSLDFDITRLEQFIPKQQARRIVGLTWVMAFILAIPTTWIQVTLSMILAIPTTGIQVTLGMIPYPPPGYR